ncbi:MAG: hypothetical protein V3V08_05140 [Nannocystaceae bacterium]
MITLRNDPTDVRAVLRFVRELPTAGGGRAAVDHETVDRSLSGPQMRDHYQLGELRAYACAWGDIEVSSRGNVVRMIADLNTTGAVRLDLADAGERAAKLLNKLVEDSPARNLAAEAGGLGGGAYEFRWLERPRPGQYSIYPNDITIRLSPTTGEVVSFFATDIRAYRNTAPGLHERDVAGVIATALPDLEHHIRQLCLVEDPIRGGMETRTVYQAAVARARRGEPKRWDTVHLLIDADSGALIDNGP